MTFELVVVYKSFHPPVVFFIDQVIPGSESDQVSVVSRSRDGNGSCAADISVAQLVGEYLQFVGNEVVVIPENMIVGWSGSALQETRSKFMRLNQIKTTNSPSKHKPVAVKILFFMKLLGYNADLITGLATVKNFIERI